MLILQLVWHIVDVLQIAELIFLLAHIHYSALVAETIGRFPFLHRILDAI